MSLVDRLAAAAQQFEALAFDCRELRGDPWMAAVYDRQAAAVREAIPIVATAMGARPQPVAVHADEASHVEPDPPAA